jgi:excisionase family DNA binding protein
MAMSVEDPILTVRQLAARHGLSRDVVYKWLRRGGLPCVRTGGYRIRYSDFTRWWGARSARPEQTGQPA